MCIRMGIIIFIIFIWGGISSVIWSNIRFYLNEFSDHITDDIPPQINILKIQLSSKLVFWCESRRVGESIIIVNKSIKETENLILFHSLYRALCLN